MYNKYLKYKKKYTQLKMYGGKKKYYDTKICFNKDYNWYAGDLCNSIKNKIKVYPNEKFNDILNKLNNYLDQNGYKTVQGFNYIQEDGDYAYVSQKIVDETDFYDALKYNTTLFVDGIKK